MCSISLCLFFATAPQSRLIRIEAMPYVGGPHMYPHWCTLVGRDADPIGI